MILKNVEEAELNGDKQCLINIKHSYCKVDYEHSLLMLRDRSRKTNKPGSAKSPDPFNRLPR